MSRLPGPPRAPRPAAVLVLLVVLFGALGACTDILGITDRQLTSSSGAGGDGGGTGGTTSTGTGGDDGACTTDADCIGSKYGEACDLSTQRCVECLPLPAQNICSLGLYCDPTKICVIGCASDADCNPQGSGPLTCDTSTHQCTGCSSSAPCPPGSKCELSSGACVPGCDDTPDCPSSDWACCLKQCKNVTKDVANCGDCEDPCIPSDSTAWICLDGGCVFQSCANGWADCDQNLAEKNGCETNTLADPLHCGDCDTECDLPNAVEGCANGVCNIQSCEPGFADCDQKVKTGCEADLTTSNAHCGGCNQPCDGFTNGIADCQNSGCVLVGCNSGFGDCDDNPDNGCETNTKSSEQHCGGCGDPCELPHAESTCAGSQCLIAACDPGFEDCNGLASDGCEANLATDRQHCGQCFEACEYDNAAGSCNAGQCEIGACAEGFENCNGLTSDGCEINTNTDEENCGDCGAECVANNGVPTCQMGACEFLCDPDFGDCDQLPANGCEASLEDSVQNCGDCSTTCPAAGGTPYCFNSMCGVSNCAPGTANCDGNPANGCETDITGPNNCGSCGNKCSTTNANPSCNGSTCTITCNTGFGDCNNNLADGCEQPLITNQHCTSCGTPCTKPHAFTSCGTGSCQIVSCEDGWADCNNNPSDGCETNIDSSATDCGGCDILCAPPNAVGVCVDGGCTIGSCNAPFANCNGGVLDGCEANTGTSEDHCGGCGTVCNLPNATSTCNAGDCEVQSCTGAFADCDGDHPNGCEANTQTNVNHCGGCGNVCSTNNGMASCGGGQCGITCDPGFKTCDGDVSNGCETPVNTTTDCGDCGVPCSFPNASASCSTGTCTLGGCENGFINCDNMAANGCECGTTCAGLLCQGCGNAMCDAGENCETCPSDCACVCGDNACSAGESCDNCLVDCPACTCGDGACTTGEHCDNCPGDCPSCFCADGTCSVGEECASCPTDCPVCFCGDGACTLGESCNNCPMDCPSCFCGDGACSLGENCDNCFVDCPACTCGDGACTTPLEDCLSCPADCSCGSGGMGGGGSGGMGGGGSGATGGGGSTTSSSSSTTTTTTTSTSGTSTGVCGPFLGVECPGVPCMPGLGCCFPDMGSPSCGMNTTCMPPDAVFFACDDKSDCTVGSVCCHTTGGGSFCSLPAACTDANEVELCTSPTAGAPSCECSNGDQCCPTGAKNANYPTCQPGGDCL